MTCLFLLFYNKIASVKYHFCNNGLIMISHLTVAEIEAVVNYVLQQQQKQQVCFKVIFFPPSMSNLLTRHLARNVLSTASLHSLLFIWS